MINISRRFIIQTMVVLAFVGLAPTTHAAISVNCGTESLSSVISTAIAASKPGEKLVFDVKGSCDTHLSIPQGINVILTGTGKGSYGATLTASDAKSVIVTNGSLTLNDIEVTTTGLPDAVIQVNPGGSAYVNDSKVYATTSMALYGTSLAYVSILNSSITAGGNGALELYQGSSASVSATAGKSTTLTYVDPAASDDVIGCYDSSLQIDTSGTGKVTIGPSTSLLVYGIGCGGQIGSGESGSSPSVRLTGGNNGLFVRDGGSFSINNTSFDSITGETIEVRGGGSVRLNYSTISVPSGSSGLVAKGGGVIFFDRQSVNNSTVSGVAYPYTCYQDGHIYAEIAPLGGGASNGCLTIGGTYQN